MANLLFLDQRNFFGSDISLSHLLEPEDLCYVIKEELVPLIKDSDFEDMYKDGGRPPISPRLLVLVLLMQFLEGLSDRAAARNLKFRLDWKIAFELSLEFASIHPTTLTHFRDRLIANEAASYAFDRILEHLTRKGLIKANGKQRIDSTHIIGFVRELSRIELLHETLRLFSQDVGIYKSEMDENLLTHQERYVDKVSTYRMTDADKKFAIQQSGLAMKAFQIWANATPAGEEVRAMKSFKILSIVFEQNFIDKATDPELIKVSTGKGHICSPHESEAEYANKGKKGWIGYKAQVAETVNDDGSQNFITHIELTAATDFDGDCVESVINDLESKQIMPSELYGDTHYNTCHNIKILKSKAVDLKGEVMPISNAKATKDLDFEIRLEENKVICPMGIESKFFRHKPNRTVSASFPKQACIQCLRREICQPKKRGKIYIQRPTNPTLDQRRKQLEDPVYRKDLNHRNGVEGTISGLVRGQKLRRCRYRGKAKGQLQTKMSGAAANVMRLHVHRQRELRVCA